MPPWGPKEALSQTALGQAPQRPLRTRDREETSELPRRDPEVRTGEPEFPVVPGDRGRCCCGAVAPVSIEVRDRDLPARAVARGEAGRSAVLRRGWDSGGGDPGGVGVGPQAGPRPRLRGPGSLGREKWDLLLEKLHLPVPLHLPSSPSLSRSDCPSVVPRSKENLEVLSLEQHRGLDPAHGEAV